MLCDVTALARNTSRDGQYCCDVTARALHSNGPSADVENTVPILLAASVLRASSNTGSIGHNILCYPAQSMQNAHSSLRHDHRNKIYYEDEDSSKKINCNGATFHTYIERPCFHINLCPSRLTSLFRGKWYSQIFCNSAVDLSHLTEYSILGVNKNLHKHMFHKLAALWS
jgi:hypothetical protein